MQVITFGTPANNGFENGRIQVISLAPAQVEAQPEAPKTDTVKKLQKEAKAYGKTEVFYDVYCDRVNFAGFNTWMIKFFERRQVVADFDRAGVSISLEDAIKLGLPTQNRAYRIPADGRKKLAIAA